MRLLKLFQSKRQPAAPKRRTLAVQELEARQLLTAMPLGAMPRDTGEFMLGRIAVTPVLLESNGVVDPSTEDWSAFEINQVLDNVRTGMQWWVDTLDTFDTPHTLEFVFDERFAVDPFETPYEPISRQSNSFPDYVGHFLQAQGYGDLGLNLEDAMRAFNHDQRTSLGTDWAFTIFVVDSSNDIDGMFEPSGTFRQAFAFAGGLFMVVPSGRPASTYAHETGHMFWARDEYAGSGSYTDRRGYYNTQNTNAIDGAPPGFVQEPSIMASGFLLQTAYTQNVSAAATLAQLGWQDSDQNGIFDVLDVPLQLDAAVVYSETTELLSIDGSAQAVPMLNRNSSGLQNDITLNRVSRLEVSVDGGNWTTIATPDLQVAEFELEIPVSSGFNELRLRAVDALTGISSNVITVTPDRPTSGGGNVDGFAFIDENQDQRWSSDEMLLSGVTATILTTGNLNRGIVEPDETPNTVYDSLPGLQIQSVGNQADGLVSAFRTQDASTGEFGFFYRTIFGTWGNHWAAVKQEFEVLFDAPTSAASIMAVGKQSNSYGRIEAYDSSGNLIARSTSGPLAPGQAATLVVSDDLARIARIKAFGTAGTEVALDRFEYGPEIMVSSSVFGTFQFTGLPDGTYQIGLQSPNGIYEIIDPVRSLEIVGGVAQPMSVVLTEVESPWTNPDDPNDVNDDGSVQPLDALIIINELNRNGTRTLGESDLAPPYMDVDGNGSITPLDALRVINFLNRSSSGGMGSEGEAGSGTDSGNRGGTTPSGAFGGLTGEGEPSSAWRSDPTQTATILHQHEAFAPVARLSTQAIDRIMQEASRAERRLEDMFCIPFVEASSDRFGASGQDLVPHLEGEDFGLTEIFLGTFGDPLVLIR